MFSHYKNNYHFHTEVCSLFWLLPGLGYLICMGSKETFLLSPGILAPVLPLGCFVLLFFIPEARNDVYSFMSQFDSCHVSALIQHQGIRNFQQLLSKTNPAFSLKSINITARKSDSGRLWYAYLKTWLFQLIYWLKFECMNNTVSRKSSVKCTCCLCRLYSLNNQKE